MRYVYALLAVLGFFSGFVDLLTAESALHQIVGYMSFLIAAVFCVAAEIVESRQAKSVLQHRIDTEYGPSGERID